MKTLSLQENVTAIFVIATYHWLIGDNKNAESALLVAVQFVERGHLALA